jgi:hypothetical protein
MQASKDHRRPDAVRRAGATAALALGLALVAPPSLAAPPQVVLVGRAADDAALARLRAELEALGFQVVETPAPTTASGRDALDAAARAAGAVAAVRLVPSSTGGGVEVWIFERVTGKTVLREVVAPDASAGGAASTPATIALRAVELLRASLLEMDAPHPSRGEIAPTAELRAIAGPVTPPAFTSSIPPIPPFFPPIALPRGPEVAPPRWARFGAAIAPAVAGSPGGVPAALLVDVRLRWMPLGRFGVSAGALIPTVAGTIKTSKAAADARQGLVGGGVRVELGSPASAWSPTLEGGFAAAWLHTQGVEASPPLIVLGRTVFAAAPYLRAGLAFALDPRIALRADALGAVTLPDLRVDFVNVEVARWGRPFLAGSLGIEASIR